VFALEQRPAKLQLRAAMEVRDLAAILDTFAPDAVLRSPFTEKLTFNGHEQIATTSQVILDVSNDLQCTDELCGEEEGFLVASAKIGGQTSSG
jgi:ketosteroid isomerase-like protein